MERERGRGVVEEKRGCRSISVLQSRCSQGIVHAYLCYLIKQKYRKQNIISGYHNVLQTSKTQIHSRHGCKMPTPMVC